MKIYISGKIAGDPGYKGKFARAAAQLEQMGATVWDRIVPGSEAV